VKNAAALTMTTILVLGGVTLFRGGVPATAQTDQSGWLEGTVVSKDGEVITNSVYSGLGGATIRGVRQGGGNFEVTSNYKMGGLFSVRDLKPGIYEISVTNGVVRGVKHCPQRVFGVLVKPGVRTVLNVKLERGDTLEEIGEPVVATQPAITVSEELARLQRQIDELKKR